MFEYAIVREQERRTYSIVYCSKRVCCSKRTEAEYAVVKRTRLCNSKRTRAENIFYSTTTCSASPVFFARASAGGEKKIKNKKYVAKKKNRAAPSTGSRKVFPPARFGGGEYRVTSPALGAAALARRLGTFFFLFSMCMCMDIYLCISICTYTVHVYVHILRHTYVYILMYKYMYIYCTYVCMYVWFFQAQPIYAQPLYACMHVCMYVCMQMQIA